MTRFQNPEREAALAAEADTLPEDRSQGLFDFTPAPPPSSDEAATVLASPGVDAAPWAQLQRQQLNSILAVALVAIVAIAPLPLGSNRPVFWMIWSAVIFGLLAVYLAIVGRRRLNLRTPPYRVPVVSLAALAFLAFGIAQVVPARLFPTEALSHDVPRISVARDATIVGLLRWSSYVAFGFLALQVSANRARARKLAWGLFIIIFVYSAYGLLSFRFFQGAFPWGPSGAYGDVITSTFVNRNSFATFAGMGAILGLALLLHDLRVGDRHEIALSSLISMDSAIRVLGWICLATIVAALVGTASRMGIAATAAGALLVIMLTLIKAGVRWSDWAGITLAALAVAGVAGIFAIFGQTALERLIFSLGGRDGRVDLYAQVIDMIRSRPWLGYGFDTFGLAFEQFHRPPVSPDLVWSRAHSTYLALWAEMGLVAGSLPMLICLAFATKLTRIVIARQRDVVLAIAGLGVILQVALHSTVDFSLEMEANVLMFIAIMALAANTSAKSRRHSAPPA